MPEKRRRAEFVEHHRATENDTFKKSFTLNEVIDTLVDIVGNR
jgi:hypothetical protein